MNQLCYQSISAGISNLTLFFRSIAKYRITHINEKYFTLDESRAAWGRHKLTGHAKMKRERIPKDPLPRWGAPATGGNLQTAPYRTCLCDQN